MAYESEELNERSISLEDILATDNVAELLDTEELDEMALTLKARIDEDLQSRQQWEKNIDMWVELSAQVLQQKTTPWQGAANVKYPLLTIASMQFAARAYSALLPGTQWVSGKVIGKDIDGKKRERAIRIGKHMTYQLMEEMEEWEEEQDRMLHVLPLVGTAFKKVYFDPDKARNVAEYVPAKDLVVDYNAKNINNVERKTHLLSYYEHELESRFRSGFFMRPEEELVTSFEDKRKTNADITQSLYKPSTDSSLHNIGECHCYWDLDGDGLAEPYIVHIHLGACKVLRITANFGEEDILEGENGIISITPRAYFVSYIFIPDPNSGVYGLGFGHLLGPLNETINTIINQLIDSGSMSVLGGGFITKNFALRGGPMKFKPHEWKVINAVGRDIKDGIMPLPVREPSGVLFSLLGFLENSGMRLASAVDLLSGDIPGQNTKATVALASIEQGLKVFTSIHKRLHKSFKRELKLLFRLNSEYLLDEEYVNVLDDGSASGANIAREDYDLAAVDILPYSDPNVSSEQIRLARAQALFDVLPLGTVNPVEVTRRYLEATEQPSVDVLMDVQPPQPDPEIVMKQIELQHTIQKDRFNMQLDAIRSDIQMLREKSVAILNLAKAEGVEKGQQLDLYKDTMDRMAEQEQRLMDMYKEMLLSQQQQQSPNGEQQ